MTTPAARLEYQLAYDFVRKAYPLNKDGIYAFMFGYLESACHNADDIAVAQASRGLSAGLARARRDEMVTSVDKGQPLMP